MPRRGGLRSHAWRLARPRTRRGSGRHEQPGRSFAWWEKAAGRRGERHGGNSPAVAGGLREGIRMSGEGLPETAEPEMAAGERVAGCGGNPRKPWRVRRRPEGVARQPPTPFPPPSLVARASGDEEDVHWGGESGLGGGRRRHQRPEETRETMKGCPEGSREAPAGGDDGDDDLLKMTDTSGGAHPAEKDTRAAGGVVGGDTGAAGERPRPRPSPLPPTMQGEVRFSDVVTA